MVNTLKKNKGFTLVELLIVTSIFVALTTIVLVRYSGFNSRIVSTNLAYDIALSLRKAQTYGLNVRGFDTGNNIIFDTGYGIHFEDGVNTYILFADLNGNNRYAPNELVETFSIGAGHYIKSFCGTISVGNENCSDTGGLDDLDIVFTRPEPEASIKSFGPEVTYQTASITISSSQNIDRQVIIYSTGQISIVTNP